MSVEDAAILARRAGRLARQGASEDAEDAVAWEVVVCRIGSQHWALPLDALERVTRTPSVTPLPGQPAAVAGVAHVFGELMSVVSGQHLLSDRPAYGIEPWVVGLRLTEGQLALGVDEVLGARRIAKSELDESWRRMDGSLTAARTRDHVAVLDIQALAGDHRVRVSPEGKAA